MADAGRGPRAASGTLTRAVQLVCGRTVAQKRARQGYLFVAPALFFVGLLFVFPFGYNLVLSFADWRVSRPMEFIGLENYQYVLGDPEFWQSVLHTVYFAALSVPTTIGLALAVAIGLHRIGPRHGSALLRALYFLPVIASLTAVAYIWAWIFNPAYGLLNALLKLASLPTLEWLQSRQQVIPSLSLMYVWARLGFDMLILLAGLTAIAPEYYEAARIDGASAWQNFRHVTLPLLNRPLVLVSVVEVMTALKVFELPYAATAGGPVNASRTLVMHIYLTGFKFLRMGEAAVGALVLFALVMLLTLAQRAVFSRDVSQ
jgi:ABC-type sugar transport system permease subunit